LVIAGEDAYVIDTGPESWETLARIGFPAARIRAVFLTHFHSDHIGELGEFRMQTMVAGRSEKLPVFGPRGVKSVVAGFNKAYEPDARHRLDHHGPGVIDIEASPLVARQFGRSFKGGDSAEEVVFEADGLTVTAFEVDHDPVQPSVGYRFDWNGRSIVISGDTAVSANLVENARGADVLVGDSLAAHLIGLGQQQAAAAGNARLAKILGDIPDYHATPVEMAEMANAAGVRLLVYTHFVPSGPVSTSPAYFAGVAEVRPAEGWVGGRDGGYIELPTGSDEIRRSELLAGG
jgi:ribonuclease Z